jgi:hypothetical protein
MTTESAYSRHNCKTYIDLTLREHRLFLLNLSRQKRRQEGIMMIAADENWSKARQLF